MFVAASNLEEIIYKILNEPIVLLGFAGQACFFLRFLVQWIVSEKKGESIVPTVFWYISLAGAATVFVYGWIVREPILVVGQLISSFVYVRNLFFIYAKAKKTKPFAEPALQLEIKETKVDKEFPRLRSIDEIKKKIIRLEEKDSNSEANVLRWALGESAETM